MDVETLGLDHGVPPAFLGFNLSGHTLARAVAAARFSVDRSPSQVDWSPDTSPAAASRRGR
ncbi:YbhB/YbcL family Raf kinase inhibitor-like protein [Streptomyces olivaceoviridis]|uniref:hypothetical protein n=1 Tax=Streptomyces olivaceoviridis TaxID=1921 RepID=UPI0036F8977C